MNPLNLPRLQSLHHENPTKRISLIRLVWPDIEKALSRGHTLKLIHSRLKEDGLFISYSLLSLYLRRLQNKGTRKRERHQIQATQRSSSVQTADYESNRRAEDAKTPSAPSASERDAPEGGTAERVLWTREEFMAANKRDSHQGDCFFKETVPDINELFRVTKKSETAAPANT
jgi:hypothetical protein